MARDKGRILKKASVNVTGAFMLGGAAGGASPQGGPQGQPRARLIDQGPAGDLIEVTCACGRTIHVQCEYHPQPSAPAGAAAPSQGQSEDATVQETLQ